MINQKKLKTLIGVATFIGVFVWTGGAFGAAICAVSAAFLYDTFYMSKPNQ